MKILKAAQAVNLATWAGLNILAFTSIALYFYSHIPLVNHPELWLEFGISVILQGTFLLIIIESTK